MQKKVFEAVQLQVILLGTQDFIQTSLELDIDVSEMNWGNFQTPFKK